MVVVQMEVGLEFLVVVFVKMKVVVVVVEMVVAKDFMSSFSSDISFNLSNLLMAKSTPGGLGAFFISSRAMPFFPTSSSFNKEPPIGFSASNVEMSLKSSSSGFCLLIIFLLLILLLLVIILLIILGTVDKKLSDFLTDFVC